MADGIPSTLARLRAEVAEMRGEIKVDLSVQSEALTQALHKLDQLLARGNGRPRKTSRVRKRRPRDVR